jgi:small-conductance mechanosensitive channel
MRLADKLPRCLYRKVMVGAGIVVRISILAIALLSPALKVRAQEISPTITPTMPVSPSIGPTPAAPTAGPTLAVTSLSSKPGGKVLHRTQIIDYLGRVIRWHKTLPDQLPPVTEPEETIHAIEERQTADEVLKLAFEFARAAAQLLEEESALKSASVEHSNASPQTTTQHNGDAAMVGDLQSRRGEVQTNVDQLKDQLQQSRSKLTRASQAEKSQLSRDVIAIQAQLNLAQSRLDSLDAMIAFESSNVANTTTAAGLDAQIDELEHSAPPLAAAPTAPTPAQGAPIAPPGVFGRAGEILKIIRKSHDLAHAVLLSQNLHREAVDLRTALVDRLAELDREALARTARDNDQSVAMLKQTRAEFDQLTRQGKLLSAASLPLAKQAILLDLYIAGLNRWQAEVNQQFHDALWDLIIRVGVIGLMLLAIFVGAAAWRRLIIKYVQDLQRRAQLQQLRRLTVIAAIALLSLLAFSNQLSTIATVMGLAAAGVALALQNVILSLAGYFYLSGRFGIRVGDRVQIAGITGDVLENGFFRLTLMEVAGDESGREPTGRAVIFPNSVVFQPNSNFFRQLPGATFCWHELRLTLAPDCDYRLAEQRLNEVINAVFARDRDRINSEYRLIERELELRIETPRPRTRLSLGPRGLEIVIRYPARLTGAVRTADEIARRLLDAIKREPGLRLAAASVPLLQNDPEPSAESPAESATVESGHAESKPIAAVKS